MDMEGTEGVAAGAETQAGGATTETPDKGDYLGRIRTDPEFAVETVRSRDQKISQQHDRLKKLDGLEAYVEAAGGVEGLLGYIDYANKIAVNPTLKDAVDDALRTGRVPDALSGTPSAQATDDDDDLFTDPDVKALRAKLAETESRLERFQQDSNQRLVEAESAGFRTGIQDNITQVIERYGVNGDIRDEMAQAIQAKVEMAERQALGGDPAARNLLKTLASPEGLKTMRYVVADVVDANLGVIAAARETQRTQAAVASSTGDPGQARTSGGDVNAMPGDALRGTTNWVREVLEKATKDAGRDPNSMWGR